jgi:type VI secretion system protein ImpF
MAELLQKERLQPSLLDRLMDDEPGNTRESREKRVLSEQKLKQSVLRDLIWLLNARSLTSVQSLDDHPEVASSVVNYGIRDLAGTMVTGADALRIERSIRQAILDFEPRIVPQTLKVKVVVEEGKMNLGAVTFDIEGELWAQPLPIHLYIRTELDMETGTASVRDLAG